MLSSMLKRSYTDLVGSDQEHWGSELQKWEEFDREVFQHPDTVGRCVFLSWADGQLVGFASYDPRQRPEIGIVGHNCILPEFCGQGFGRQQIQEIIRRLRAMGIRKACASTGEHAFFTPARRMYVACGFRETCRRLRNGDPSISVVDYEIDLCAEAVSI